MGIDNANIYNHNLKFSNAVELTSVLENRLGLPVVNDIYDADGNRVQGYPNGFNGIVMNTEDELTMQDYMDKSELLEFDRINPEDDRGHFYLNHHVIENSLPEAYMYRWWDTKEMCVLIRKYGIQSFESYKERNITLEIGVWNGTYALEQRSKCFSFIQKFGSAQKLTFCDDHHSEFLDHIAENWSFDDFVSWGKKDFIYVRFEDLPFFDFPVKKPDCYNVFIHDRFLDLQ